MKNKHQELVLWWDVNIQYAADSTRYHIEDCIYYFAADIALSRWILSQDHFNIQTLIDHGLTINTNILKKLDNGFRRLTWARRQSSPSLLKRFLTKSIFQQLKLRQTLSGTNLHDIAQSGFEHLDSPIGLFVPDLEAYEVFRPIIHPALCITHNVTPNRYNIMYTIIVYFVLPLV